MQVNTCGEVAYLTFPLLEETGMVDHLFSTRLGGASKGIYSSMNLSYTRGDLKEAVDENFKRIAGIFGKTPDHIVCSKQTHTTNVLKVTQKDCGKGVTRPLDYTDVDGLITNEEGVILATFLQTAFPFILWMLSKEPSGFRIPAGGELCREWDKRPFLP